MKKVKVITLLVFALLISLAPVKLMSLGKKVELEVLQPLLLKKDGIHLNGIKIGFYGTSCITVSYKGNTFLNDPFFSNPNYYQLMTGKYEDRSAVIEPVLNKLDSISMVTITHGHYDHCMDLPSFESKYEHDTKFISSSSTLRALAPWIKDKNNWRQYHIERLAENNWIYSQDKNFRVYPVKSTHQAHIGKNIKLFSGSYEIPLNLTPGPVWQWLEGGTYSYLLDVMDGEKIVSRILIISGEVPDESLELLTQLKKERDIDIMFTPFWHKEKSGDAFESSYNKLNPKQVIFHHWNNFFKDPEKPLQSIRSSDIEDEVKEKRSAGYPVAIMLPFSEITI